MTIDVSHCWPAPSVTLLLKAALHPSDEVARSAWREWEALALFEQTDWAGMRIFPIVARRLKTLGVESPLLPRFVGVQRFMWAKMQSRLRLTRPHIAAMVEAGITPMLTKGAARLALDPQGSSERYSHDVDMLIRPENWATVVDLLLARGLTNPNGLSRDRLVHDMPGRWHAQSVKDGEVELDLHRFALLWNQLAGDDDPMVSRALPGQFLGVPVMAPCASDRLMMAFGHGLLFTPGQPVDWAFDAVHAIASPDFDWSVFEDEVKARALSAPAICGLRYLHEVLEIPAPVETRRRLAEDASPAFVEELHSVFRSYHPRDARDAAARFFSETERARRAAARLPAEALGAAPTTAANPLAPATWAEAEAIGAGVFGLLLPSGLDSRRDLCLEVALPPNAAKTQPKCRLDAFEVFFTVLAAWTEPGDRSVKFRLPGPLLLLSGAKRLLLRLDAPAAFSSVRYRWAQGEAA